MHGFIEFLVLGCMWCGEWWVLGEGGCVGASVWKRVRFGPYCEASCRTTVS